MIAFIFLPLFSDTMIFFSFKTDLLHPFTILIFLCRMPPPLIQEIPFTLMLHLASIKLR